MNLADAHRPKLDRQRPREVGGERGRVGRGQRTAQLDRLTGRGQRGRGRLRVSDQGIHGREHGASCSMLTGDTD